MITTFLNLPLSFATFFTVRKSHHVHLRVSFRKLERLAVVRFNYSFNKKLCGCNKLSVCLLREELSRLQELMHLSNMVPTTDDNQNESSN